MNTRLFLAVGALVVIAAFAYVLVAGNRKVDKNAQLASACATGDLPAIKKLLSSGAQLDSQTSGTGFTPLHWAAYEEQFEVVRFLLELGADPLIKDAHGETVQDLLKKSNSPEAKRYLNFTRQPRR